MTPPPLHVLSYKLVYRPRSLSVDRCLWAIFIFPLIPLPFSTSLLFYPLSGVQPWKSCEGNAMMKSPRWATPKVSPATAAEWLLHRMPHKKSDIRQMRHNCERLHYRMRPYRVRQRNAKALAIASPIGPWHNNGAPQGFSHSVPLILPAGP